MNKKLSIYFFLPIAFTAFGQSFQFKSPAPNSNFMGNDITKLEQNASGEIVCLTRGDSMISIYNGNTWSYVARESKGFTLSGSASNELEIAPNGDFWIAQPFNLDIYNGTNVVNMSTSNSQLTNDFVVDVAINQSNQTFIAYSNGFGISMINGGIWTHRGNFTGGLSQLNSSNIPRFIEANPTTNEFWYGEANGNFFKITNTTMTKYEPGSAAGLPSNVTGNVTDMAFTNDGKVWFSLSSNNNDPAEGGILSFNGTTWMHYNTLNSTIGSNQIRSITDYGNQVAFAVLNSNGIRIFNGTSTLTYNSANSNFPGSLPTVFVRELITEGSTVYGATDYGLMIFDLPILDVNELFTSTEALLIYPNPTQDLLFFGELVNEIAIYTLTGQEVLHEKNCFHISLQHLAKGSYIINGTTKNGNLFIERITVD